MSDIAVAFVSIFMFLNGFNIGRILGYSAGLRDAKKLFDDYFILKEADRER